MDIYQKCREFLNDILESHKPYNKTPLLNNSEKCHFREDHCIDYIWLNCEIMSKLNTTYLDEIHELNQSFELEKGHHVIDTNYIYSETYTESLYLLYMFLNNQLFGTPLGHKIDYEYFHVMTPVLKELCLRGVYVIAGTLPMYDKKVSQCIAMVVLRKDTFGEFRELLDKMFDKGINVQALNIQNQKVVSQYTRIKGVHLEPLYLNVVVNLFSINGINNHSFIVKDTYQTHYMIYLNIWNQTTEMMNVEYNLLHIWLKFNAHYGYINNYAYNGFN